MYDILAENNRELSCSKKVQKVVIACVATSPSQLHEVPCSPVSPPRRPLPGSWQQAHQYLLQREAETELERTTAPSIQTCLPKGLHAAISEKSPPPSMSDSQDLSNHSYLQETTV